MPEPWTRGPVVVTGGTGLLGLAIVRTFVKAGAVTIAVGSTEERRQAAQAELAALGGEGHALRADLGDPHAVKALFDEVEAGFGPVSVLINGAGTNFNRLIRDVTPDDFDRLFRVNVKSAFFASKEACERMAAARIAGRVINITSGNYRYARPDAALYCATKAAMEMLTRGFALEYGPHDIAVNAVAPGLVDNPGQTDPGFARVADYYRQNSTQSALATGEDVADAVLFLASSRAARVAGETLVVDGGFSAGRLDFPRRSS